MDQTIVAVCRRFDLERGTTRSRLWVGESIARNDFVAYYVPLAFPILLDPAAAKSYEEAYPVLSWEKKDG